MFFIYTDGSMRMKDNEGGFGVVIFDDSKRLIHAYQEQEKDTTNNRMELKAIIYSYEWIKKNNYTQDIIIYSDSSYCVNSINCWMETWIQNNWINSQKKPVKNIELMKVLYNYSKIYNNVTVKYLKGHNNSLGNELADALATKNANKFQNLIIKHNVKIMK